MHISIGDHVRWNDERYPQVGRTVQTGSGDAHDRKRRGVQREGRSNDGAIAAEAAPPEFTAQDDETCVASSAVAGTERASQRHRSTEQRKPVRAHLRAGELLRLAVATQDYAGG